MQSIYPIYYNFIPSPCRFPVPLPERGWQTFNTPGCEYLLFVSRSCLRCVAWFSYWFDNLGLITEGNTYRCCAASSLPLWGNTDVILADIKLQQYDGPASRNQSDHPGSTIFIEGLARKQTMKHNATNCEMIMLQKKARVV